MADGRMEPWFWIGVLIVIVIIIWAVPLRDNFGQDPSIRASVGWIAGPDYGYDPITQFAEQIDEMKEDLRSTAQRLGCHEICERDGKSCRECIQYGLQIAHQKWPLVGNPADEIGPLKEGYCKACV